MQDDSANNQPTPPTDASPLLREVNRPATERFTTEARELLVTRALNWFDVRGYTRNEEGLLLSLEGRAAEVIRVRRQYMLDSAAFRDARRGITEASLKDAFDEALDILAERVITSTIEQLKFVKKEETFGQAELARWLEGMTGRCNEVELAVMKHFIWQVKRKLCNKPVTHHIMPVFSGMQGTGKSTAIMKLLGPAAPLALFGKPVSFVTDDRQLSALSKHYIVFFDEMAKADTTDVEKLKQVVSAHVLDYRPLFTNTNSRVAQNCTFIGATNKDIRDLIRDNTGMRRFYQIPIDPRLMTDAEMKERCRQLINETQALAIWQGIDETRDEVYISSYFSEIEREQEEVRARGSVEEFVVESELAPGKHQVPVSTLYENYRNFCGLSGRRDVAMLQTFSRELTTRGFEKKRKKSGVVFCVDNSGRLMDILEKPVTLKTVSEV